MGKFLDGLTIAVTGSFGENRKREEYKRWIEGSGGKFVSSLAPTVTHLVIAEDAWNTKPQIVQDALEQDKIGLVKQAWLDDALQGHKKPLKKIPNHQNWRVSAAAGPSGVKKNTSPDSKSKATKTSMGSKVSRSGMVQGFSDETSKYASSEAKKRKKSKEKAAIIVADKEFAKSATSARKFFLSNDYHHYMDHSNFVFNIQLLRILHERNLFQRVQLQVFESNLEPHVYATVSTHTDLHGTPERALVIPNGANFATAMRGFKAEFKARTGIEWAERMKFCKRTKPRGLGGVNIAQEKKEFLDPATLYLKGGPRHGELVEAVSKEMLERFEARPFTWRAPREGEPEGDDIVAEKARKAAEAEAQAKATPSASQEGDSEQINDADEDAGASSGAMAE